MKPILSLVVPTKNRYVYLTDLVKMFVSFQLKNTELVIQDNSDDNSAFLSFISQFKLYKNIRYYYNNTHLSVCENCDKAIQSSLGEYVCMIGDDDGFLRTIESYVEYMKNNDIDSLIANKPAYKLPELHGLIFDFSGTVRIKKYKKSTSLIDVKDELKKVLKNGASTLGKLPCVYHGIVKREILDKIYVRTGSFFPGPSPDMANAIALGICSSKHIYYDIPLVISGHGSKSAGGMGAKHQHKNELKNMSFLPKDTDKLWESKIPKYWTGETIYAESAVKSLKRMGERKLLNYFNYRSMYGRFIVFHLPEYKLVLKLMNIVDYLFLPHYVFKAFILRMNAFIRNCVLKMGLSHKMYVIGSLSNIIECEEQLYQSLK